MTSRHDPSRLEAEATARRLIALTQAVDAGRMSADQARNCAANATEGISNDVKQMVAEIVHHDPR